jgi:fatty acid desaturase
VLTAAIIVVLIILAAATFWWVFRGMQTHICPECRESAGMEENLIPIIPLLRWWCPVCSHIFKNSEVSSTSLGSEEDEGEDVPPRI